MVAEGDRLQIDDTGFRAELAHWIRSRGLGVLDILLAVGSLIIRTFDLGNGIAASDERKIAAVRPKLKATSGLDAFLQILQRIGRAGSEPSPPARRDLDDVILTWELRSGEVRLRWCRSHGSAPM
ncbi:MAG: hypothetical protein WAT09_16025 [Paracoccaceae bacterium]